MVTPIGLPGALSTLFIQQKNVSRGPNESKEVSVALDYPPSKEVLCLVLTLEKRIHWLLRLVLCLSFLSFLSFLKLKALTE